MLRRIVLLKPREPLGEAWNKRSFSAAAGFLASTVGSAGCYYDEKYPPVRLTGRAAARSVLPAAAGFDYGDPGTAKVIFSQRTYFDDEEAIQRLRRDRQDEVLGVYADPRVSHCVPSYCGNAAVGTATDVARLLGVGTLRRRRFDGRNVRVAIVDTGINGKLIKVSGGWGPDPGYVPGSAPTDHGTMCAFDALIAAPRAKILDYALLRSEGNTWTAFLSDGIAAYADLQQLLQNAPGPLVVSNSWGIFDRSEDEPVGSPGNYSANPNHPFNQMVGTLVRAGADVLFAAGNCGAQCPDGRCGAGDTGRGKSIHGANSHPDVITIAAVTTDERRLGYSSQGPGGLADRKPDVGAYSHFFGSGVYPVDGGTSAACPVAAGVVAALRTRNPGKALQPAQMKGVIQRTARDLDGNGWDYDIGYGLIDAAAALAALGT